MRIIFVKNVVKKNNMPFKDLPEGQTHYYGDGCKEHTEKEKKQINNYPCKCKGSCKLCREDGDCWYCDDL